MDRRKRVIAMLLTGGVSTCGLLANTTTTLKDGPGAWENAVYAAQGLRMMIETVATMQAVYIFGSGVGFGGAFLLWAQPYVSKRYPSLFSWLRRSRAGANAPTKIAAPTLATFAGRSDMPMATGNRHDDRINSSEKLEKAASRYNLTMFAIARLLPAYDAQRKLQFVILQRLCGNNKALLEMADLGSYGFYQLAKFHEAAEQLRIEHSASRMRTMPLHRLEEIVDVMRQYYRSFCTIPDALCEAASINFKTDPELSPLWQDWRHQQIFLISGYETVRNDYLLEKIYRPNGGDEFGPIPDDQTQTAA